MSGKIGLWLVGAYGGVATTVAVGLSALKQNLTPTGGLVSELPDFSRLPFVDWNAVVLGGHEIRRSDCLTEATGLSQGPNPVIAPQLVLACQADLRLWQAEIRPGILANAGTAIEKLSSSDYCVELNTGRGAIDHIQDDLNRFKTAGGCDQVVVVNLASTEPPLPVEFPEQWNQLETWLTQTPCALPASSLYAIAALELRMPYINFTPSLGNNLAAIDELARQRNVCHTGADGKTGETFMKSVLAPAFAKRNLHIMSWVGHNIFGNLDGRILDDPANKKTKIASKGQMLQHLLGYSPQSHISIEYIESLGDWKTAWDHIHFRGFLGTPMTMQFIWQGCDSILAAPLVLDLFRFTELADRTGHVGQMPFLASFFKSPQGTDDHDFGHQFQWLLDWAKQIGQQSAFNSRE